MRGFVLTGRRSQSTADSLELLEHQWTSIVGICDAEPDGPWMYAVTAVELRRIELV